LFEPAVGKMSGTTRDIDKVIPSVRPSLYPSATYSGVVPKRLNISSKFFHCWIAPSILWFWL